MTSPHADGMFGPTTREYGPESRFTRSSPHCPHPERWHSDDADSTEHEVTALVAAFITALQPDWCVETGTAFGQTANAIGQALRANDHGYLVTFETDPARADYARNQCRGLPVTVICGDSLAPLSDLIPSVDFAWFDSLCPQRATEVRHFLPLMHDRTVIGFHDTGPQHGMKPDFDQLHAEGLIQPMYLPTPRGVGFARVIL